MPHTRGRSQCRQRPYIMIIWRYLLALIALLALKLETQVVTLSCY